MSTTVTPIRPTITAPSSSGDTPIPLANIENATLDELGQIVRIELATGYVHALNVGKALNRAKELVPRGDWGTWLEENFAGSVRSAQDLLQVAREYDAGNRAVIEAESTAGALAALRSTEDDDGEKHGPSPRRRAKRAVAGLNALTEFEGASDFIKAYDLDGESSEVAGEWADWFERRANQLSQIATEIREQAPQDVESNGDDDDDGYDGGGDDGPE